MFKKIIKKLKFGSCKTEVENVNAFKESEKEKKQNEV
jgi:hypothetical protein